MKYISKKYIVGFVFERVLAKSLVRLWAKINKKPNKSRQREYSKLVIKVCCVHVS